MDLATRTCTRVSVVPLTRGYRYVDSRFQPSPTQADCDAWESAVNKTIRKLEESHGVSVLNIQITSEVALITWTVELSAMTCEDAVVDDMVDQWRERGEEPPAPNEPSISDYESEEVQHG